MVQVQLFPWRTRKETTASRRAWRLPRISILWGSEMRFGVSCGQSGGDVVFVSESAKDLLPADPVLGEVDWFGRPGAGLGRSELAKSTMRPGSVVMP